jgi:hypothetical protein
MSKDYQKELREILTLVWNQGFNDGEAPSGCGGEGTIEHAITAIEELYKAKDARIAKLEEALKEIANNEDDSICRYVDIARKALGEDK